MRFLAVLIVLFLASPLVVIAEIPGSKIPSIGTISPYPQTRKHCSYYGQIGHDKPNGQGVITCDRDNNTKIIFEVNFIDGIPHGNGKLKTQHSLHSDREIALIVNWKNGLPFGFGKTSLIFNGVYAEFEGNFDGGKLPASEIKGTLSIAGRVLYKGQFSNDFKMHGEGIFYRIEDGSVQYAGEFFCGYPKMMQDMIFSEKMGTSVCGGETDEKLQSWEDILGSKPE